MSFVVDKCPSNIHLPTAISSNNNYSEDHENVIDKNASKKILNTEVAWYDSDDDELSIDISSKSKLKKLRREEDLTKIGDSNNPIVIDGLKYQARLRDQFEKINPTPNWIRSSITTHKSTISDDEDEIDFIHAFTSIKKEKYLKTNKIPVKNSFDISSIKYLGNITKALPKTTVR